MPSAGERLKGLMDDEAARQSAAANQAAGLQEQLTAAEAAAAALQQQLRGSTAELHEAQQALVDADRCV